VTLRADVMGYSTVALTRDALDDLKAKRGVRGTLTRTDDAGSSHTCTARCTQVRSQGGVARSVMAPNVEMVFEVLTPWKGTAHIESWAYGNQYTIQTNGVASGEDTPIIGDTFCIVGAPTRTGMVLSWTNAGDSFTLQYIMTAGDAPSGGNSITCTTAGRTWTTLLGGNPSAATTIYAVLPNNGNAPCRDAVVTVTEGAGATVTAFTVESITPDGAYWTYTGALTAVVTIDCGARTVYHGTSAAYANFAGSATDHTIEDWLLLNPGTNVLKLSATGGTANTLFGFAYSDTWE